jgi:hypothetical protein
MDTTLARPFLAASTTASTHAGRRLSRQVIAGRVLTGLVCALLLLDSLGKLLRAQAVLDGTVELGYSTDIVFGLGVTLLVSVVLYAIPATSFFGALLLTGYLGGAVATHVRVGNPLFTHVLFPTYVAALIWGGLVLRDPRVRALLFGRAVSRTGSAA